MRRNEPRPKRPSPFNDVVTATITNGSPNWWPVELGVVTIGHAGFSRSPRSVQGTEIAAGSPRVPRRMDVSGNGG
jgi:hypothetical protein